MTRKGKKEKYVISNFVGDEHKFGVTGCISNHLNNSNFPLGEGAPCAHSRFIVGPIERELHYY
jgi:hypothetical protein